MGALLSARRSAYLDQEQAEQAAGGLKILATQAHEQGFADVAHQLMGASKVMYLLAGTDGTIADDDGLIVTLCRSQGMIVNQRYAPDFSAFNTII